jgi:PilZ domain
MSTRSNSYKPERRRHQRILVPNGRAISASGSAASGQGSVDGLVSIVGLGGIFLRTKISLPTGTVVQLTIVDPHVTIEVECTVRNLESNGIGLEFTRITHENRLKLKSLLSTI